MIIHVVRPGENIYTIAQLYRVPPSTIIEDNELQAPNQIVPGQTLVILEGTRQHRVAPGQSLYSIGREYGVSVENILEVNPQITNPMQIYSGQIITIPPRTQKLGTIEVNGYAFPNIDMEVLRKTLPYLTYLSIFSYQVKPDGSLTSINDGPLIEAARNAGVAPMMVITNIDAETGGFSSDIAEIMLTNEQVQNTLIENIMATLQEKNYYGLDIDFEYIYPENRQDYNNFLNKITQRLHDEGYIVTTAIAPKISAEQQGLLYEAHDYPAHGGIVDHVIIMTYEWGYTFGPPLAVAPLNEVRRVLDYAVSVIPNEKIFMGIPNYGYDWTLPYTAGTAARTVTNTGAVDLANRVGANIQYDYQAQAPYFRYYDANGVQHEVWFEDARSIRAKLGTVYLYGLGGVSYWTINRFFPQNWLILSSLYNVKKVL